MKTSSPLTLLAVRRERELVELSIVLYRRLRTATGRECAELFTHSKNRETIANIKGLVSAYATLKDAVKIPSEFFTTKILLRISIQIMVILQARTNDPVGASLSQELRDRVAGIAPDFAGDVSLGTVKLHSCMDLETEVFKVIRGTEDFCLAGANVVVPDGEDESLALYAKDGVTKVTDIVVSETDGGQQLFCHLSDAAAVPKGTYKVRLASHGLDPTDPLTVATLTVTLVEAIPDGPALTRAASSIGMLEKEWGTVHQAEDVFVEGSNLGYAAGDSVTIADGDHTWTFTGEAIKSGSDTELVLDYMKAVREDEESGFNPETDGPLTIAYKGSTLAAEYKAAR